MRKKNPKMAENERKSLMEQGTNLGLEQDTLARMPTYKMKEVIERHTSKTRKTRKPGELKDIDVAASLPSSSSSLPSIEQVAEQTCPPLSQSVAPNTMVFQKKLSRWNELQKMMHDLRLAIQNNKSVLLELCTVMNSDDVKPLESQIQEMELQINIASKEINDLQIDLKNHINNQIIACDKVLRTTVDPGQRLHAYYTNKKKTWEELRNNF